MEFDGFPEAHRIEAVQYNACPHCHREPGFRCVSSGGSNYRSSTYVHQDRMLAYYLMRARDDYSSGRAAGYTVGYREGVEAARAALDSMSTFKLEIQRVEHEQDLPTAPLHVV